jgi:hypothetical protein
MADLSLIPAAAWCDAERRAEVVRPLVERERWPRHLVQAAAAAWPPFPSAEVEFDNLLKSTLKNDTEARQENLQDVMRHY